MRRTTNSTAFSRQSREPSLYGAGNFGAWLAAFFVRTMKPKQISVYVELEPSEPKQISATVQPLPSAVKSYYTTVEIVTPPVTPLAAKQMKKLRRLKGNPKN